MRAAPGWGSFSPYWRRRWRGVAPRRQVTAAPRGLAQTPPMGWNSWNKFGATSTKADPRDRRRDGPTGMRDAGYMYVNIDDCWDGDRDAQGYLTPDSTRFPQA